MERRRIQNWKTESLLSLKQAANILPNQPSPKTVARWTNARFGCSTDFNTNVVLESIRIGQDVMTSREAVDRFVARLNGFDE